MITLPAPIFGFPVRPVRGHNAPAFPTAPDRDPAQDDNGSEKTNADQHASSVTARDSLRVVRLFPAGMVFQPWPRRLRPSSPHDWEHILPRIRLVSHQTTWHALGQERRGGTISHEYTAG